MEKVHDPVCGMEVDAGSAAGKSSYAGQVYYFCSSSCHSKFNAHPEKFIEGGNVGAHQTVAPDKNSSKHELHSGAIYTCPMHPEIERDQLGDCPICGMALELKTISVETTEDNSELIDMTRRFWIGAALTLPVFFLAMSHLAPHAPSWLS
ncbi:MAG TPA: YHS domain-containing protein, partial [Chthoniobacterales bacterium]